MEAAFTVMAIFTLSTIIVRIASTIMRLTGLPDNVARFQSLSAMTGTGFTTRESELIVNYPITVDGDRIYLLGNGYAPTLTVRNAQGDVVYSESQPFLPQDSNITSLGIIKIPDGLPEQVGLVGFFYPTQGVLPSGAFTSVYPDVSIRC